MDYNSLYVYGIVDGKIHKTFTTAGIGNRGDKVFCVPFKDVSAIVSLSPFEEYDPTEENTLVHEQVLQELLQDGFTIAPMRFCTLLKSKQDLSKLFNSGYIAFKRNILRVRGKSEFGVKLFLDVATLQQEIPTADEILSKSVQMAKELYETLKEVVAADVLDEQVTQEMIMNGSFLVKRDAINAFMQAISNFDKRYTDKIKIRVSGPTAPYNFVNMPTK